MSGSSSESDSPTSGSRRAPSHGRAGSDGSGSSDGVLVELPGQEGGVLVNIDGSTQDPNGGGGGEETFEDANEEIGSSSERGLDESIAMIEIGEAGGSGSQLAEELARVHARFDDAHAECLKLKEEREVFGREAEVLRQMLEELLQRPMSHLEYHDRPFEPLTSDDKTPLHYILDSCSKYIIDLKDTLLAKEREVQDLTEKNFVASTSQALVDSYLASLRDGPEVAFGRLRAILDTVIADEGSIENVSGDQISIVERKTSLLVEQYRYIYYEIEKLGLCLVDIKPEIAASGNYSYYTIPSAAQGELFELKRREAELFKEIDTLKELNRGFAEQNASFSEQVEKLKAEHEQTEQKLSLTKEKLHLAVTKGKTIVQSRDTLKQSLAEKTSESERLLQELNEKSTALQSSEGRVEELTAVLEGKSNDLERSLADLQKVTDQLEFAERRLGELESSLVEKAKEFESCLKQLQQTEVALEAAKASNEELTSSLAEKSNEIEKNLVEMQKTSSAFEVAKAEAEKLGGATILLSSLQESVSQKDEVLQHIDAVLLQATLPVELQSLGIADKIEWLIQNKRTADLIFEEYRGILDLMGSVELPDDVIRGDVISKISWLVSSFSQSKDSIGKTQEEVSVLHEKVSSYELSLSSKHEELNKAHILLSSLQDSLSEKDEVLQSIYAVFLPATLPSELQSSSAADKIKWMVERKQTADLISEEHHQIVDLINSTELPEELTQSDTVSKLSWLVSSFSQFKDAIGKMQDEVSLLHQTNLSHELNLSVKHEEIERLASSILEEKRTKDVLKEEHSTLLNQHNVLSEKFSAVSSEMNELTTALVGALDMVSDPQTFPRASVIIEKCLDKLQEKTKASSFDIEVFEKMKGLLYVTSQDLVLCKSVLEENMVDRYEKIRLIDELQKVSVEVTSLRTDKDTLEKELERAEEKCSLIREKLSLAVKKGKGLMQERDGLKHAIEEKNVEIEKLNHEMRSKVSLVTHLEAEIEQLKAQFQILETESASLNHQRKQTENMLSESKNSLQALTDSIESISLSEEVGDCQGTVEKVQRIKQYIQELKTAKIRIEEELQKVKEEAAINSGRLSDALQYEKLTKDLSLHAEEKENLLLNRAALELELEKTREEASTKARSLEDAYMKVKSLEAALSHAENTMVQCEAEKNEANVRSENEISALNAKLAESRGESDRYRGILERYSQEQHGLLSDLKMLLLDRNLVSLMTEDFEMKINSVRKVSHILHGMNEQCRVKGLKTQSIAEFKDIPTIHNISEWEAFVASKMDGIRQHGIDDTSSVATLVELLGGQVKSIGSYFTDLSKFVDGDIAVLSEEVETMKFMFCHILEQQESLKSEIDNLEAHKKVQEAELLSMQRELTYVTSACVVATSEIEIILNELSSCLASEAVKGLQGDGVDVRSGDHSKAVDDLSTSVDALKVLSVKLIDSKGVLEASFGELQDEIKQTEMRLDAALQDCHQYSDKVSLLEKDLKVLLEVKSDLESKLKGYQAKEDSAKALEDERGVANPLSRNQVDMLIDRASKLTVSPVEPNFQCGVNFSSTFEKILYILDKFDELQQNVETLTYENDDMQITLESRSKEVEELKRASEYASSTHGELELKRSELVDMTTGLERIIQQLGPIKTKDTVLGQKPANAKALLLLLEKLIGALTMESESSKSRIEDLGAMLLGKEKTINDLVTQLKVLEDSFKARITQPEVAKERAIFEPLSTATSSEISEVEDVGTMRISAVSTVPTAAQSRVVRKGSGEHLVLNIGGESEHVAHEREDKGHVFKSLNSSGLVPVQGRSVADRVDSIWVSGSRLLMGQPRARMGLIAYTLIMHLWLLVAIL